MTWGLNSQGTYIPDDLERRIATTPDLERDGTAGELSYQVHRGDELALQFTAPTG